MKGRGRYGNVKKPVIDGHRFDSKREGDCYGELKLLERVGTIRNLELQPKFPIEIGGVKIMFDSGRQLTYIADFRYFDGESEEWVIADVKMQSGHRDRVYTIKRALMLAMGYEIREI